jgi:hypothetical protein
MRRMLSNRLAYSHGWGEDITHFTLEDARFAGWVSKRPISPSPEAT